MARRVGFGDGDVSRRRSVLGRGQQAARPQQSGQAPEPADPHPRSRRLSVFALLFLLFPIVFGGIGGYMLVDAIRFSGIAETAVGTVVDVETHSDSDGTSYTAIFRYTGADGRSHKAPTHIASSGYDYRIGETEEILYDPGAPNDEVRVNGVFSLWGLPVIFTGVGVLFLIGIGYVYGKHRRDRAGA